MEKLEVPYITAITLQNIGDVQENELVIIFADKEKDNLVCCFDK